MSLLGKRFLVVDDEREMRNLIREILKTKKASVKIATNGKDALAIATQFPIHVIISDLRMHSGSGLFLLKEIKKIKPDLKFVMLTGYQDASEVEIRRNGCDLYLIKPVDPEDLLEKLEALFVS